MMIKLSLVKQYKTSQHLRNLLQYSENTPAVTFGCSIWPQTSLAQYFRYRLVDDFEQLFPENKTQSPCTKANCRKT